MWRDIIKQRIKDLKSKRNTLSLKEMEEIEAGEEILERSGFFYDAVISYMQKCKLNDVVDIGCANGFQSEAFVKAGITYTGIERKERIRKHNAGEVMYIKGEYPFALGNHELAIICNCMHHGFYPYKALAMDFKTVITDKLINRSEAEKYFKISSTVINTPTSHVPLHILTRK